MGQACEGESARQVARRMGMPESTVRAIDLRYLGAMGCAQAPAGATADGRRRDPFRQETEVSDGGV